MEIEDSFRVELPVEETWRMLLDIERIAPCLPGAQLQEIAGEEYRGVVKVKVGPITAQYKGSAHFVERNDTTHTAVIVGTGRDTRGQGNASATVTMTLAADGTGTQVRVATDLSITGKVAQFGRGVMADVSAKLLAQFVENLERDVLSGAVVDLVAEAAAGEDEAHPDEAHPDETVPERAPVAPPTTNGSGSGESITVRTIDSPEATPVDLLEMGGSPVAKRLAPLVGVGLVVIVLWLVRRRRRRRSAR
ncbi:MAG: SRPBCC family protein [Acidimicrobiia bacterium]|nr:SRPBCC family protein [Acidimicrobiia bacterium]